MLAENLVLYAKECLSIPTRYVWGGIGEFVEEGVRGFDCSGLINCFRMGGLTHYEFKEELDQNSRTLFETAPKKGLIKPLPEIPGICLYMKGHVGIYIGDRRVIESTANEKFGNGVVETKVEDRVWTHWFFCPLVQYGKYDTIVLT